VAGAWDASRAVRRCSPFDGEANPTEVRRRPTDRQRIMTRASAIRRVGGNAANDWNGWRQLGRGAGHPATRSELDTLFANQARSWMYIQAVDGPVPAAVLPVVAVRETVRTDRAVRLDFQHHVVPDVGAADAASIQFLRQFAVHLVPRSTDAGAQIALQRVDQVREVLRVPAVLPATGDRQADRFVVVPVRVVTADRQSSRLLALVSVPPASAAPPGASPTS
jgi:hypothetical protein